MSNYWDENTELAVRDYIAHSASINDRNRIYENNLHKPMTKLVQNVFNRFKFIYCDDSSNNIQERVVGHVVSKLAMFDPNKSKVGNSHGAFSFCSIVAKNELIRLNNTSYEHGKRFDPDRKSVV